MKRYLTLGATALALSACGDDTTVPTTVSNGAETPDTGNNGETTNNGSTPDQPVNATLGVVERRIRRTTKNATDVVPANAEFQTNLVEANLDQIAASVEGACNMLQNENCAVSAEDLLVAGESQVGVTANGNLAQCATLFNPGANFRFDANIDGNTFMETCVVANPENTSQLPENTSQLIEGVTLFKSVDAEGNAFVAINSTDFGNEEKDSEAVVTAVIKNGKVESVKTGFDEEGYVLEDNITPTQVKGLINDVEESMDSTK